MKLLQIAGASLCIGLIASNAWALSYIRSPNAEKGEFAVEYSGNRTFDRNNAKDNSAEHEFAVEYGLNSRTMLELETELEHEPNDTAKFTELGMEARFQFFEQGENWLDSGILLRYNVALENQHADAVAIKGLLEKDIGNFTTQVNLGLEQQFGQYSNPDGAEYSFLANTHYRMQKEFEPGIELQSQFGRSNTIGHFDQQEHYIGPAVHGKLFNNVKYEAAYLLGFSDAASEGAGRVKVEYEMHF